MLASFKSYPIDGRIPTGSTYARAAIARKVTGGTVASGTALFDGSRAIADAPAWTQRYTTGAGSLWFRGSGLNVDGSPLFVLMNAGSAEVHIFEGTSWTPTRTLNKSRSSTTDILSGEVDQDDDYTYVPQSGVVFNGEIILVCGKRAISDSLYHQIAFVKSSDQGVTWQLVGDIAKLGGDDTYVGWARGREWQISINTTDGSSSADPDDIAITACDYVLDNTQATPKPGGQVCIMRMTRSGGVWTYQTPTLAYEQVRSGTHYHSALWINGAIYAFIGDSSDNNAIARIVPDDGIDNYTTTAWTTTLIHGTQATPGVAGYQGLAPYARSETEFVAAGDVDAEDVLVVDVTDHANMPITGLHGALTTGGYGNDGLYLHSATPHLWGPFVANATPTVNASPAANHGRVLFSRDGRSFAVVAGSNAASLNPMFMIGTELIGIIDGTNLKTIPVPRISTRTPLICGSAGANLVTTGPYTVSGVGTGNTQAALSANVGGQWLHPVSGEVLDPQPPSGGTPYYVTAGGSNIQLGQFRVAANVPTGDVTVILAIRPMRGQSIAPRFRVGNGSTWSSFLSVGNIVDSEHWTVVAYRTNAAIGSNYTLRVQFQSGVSATPGDFMFVPIAVYAGHYLTGWLPDVGASAVNSTLTIPLSNMGALWTVAAVQQVGQFGWDDFTSLTNPLWTARQDADNYVYCYADPANSRIVVDVVVSGSSIGTINLGSTATFRPGDFIRVVVSRGPASVVASAIINGNTITTGSLAEAPAIVPTDWRSGNVDLSSVFTGHLYNVWASAKVALSAGNQEVLLRRPTNWDQPRVRRDRFLHIPGIRGH